MTAAEETFADLWATGTYGTHPIEHIREMLAERGTIGADALRTARPGAAVLVAGLVTHRQQPGTARGVVFLRGRSACSPPGCNGSRWSPPPAAATSAELDIAVLR